MEENIILFLFGDQTEDSRSHLRALLRTELDPILEVFLQKSYEAIRLELLCPLRVEERRDWTFSNLLELLELKVQGTQRAALENAITTICQFGLFFKRCHAKRGLYPDTRSTKMVGLCTGSLAVAAISCCQTPSELLPVAIDVSVLSFRAGVLAAETGARLHCGTTDSNASWAMAIPGLEEKDAGAMIDSISKLKGIPVASRPYVGVRSARGLTICGPPYILSHIRGHKDFLRMPILSLPIYAPYHAPHLYNSDDIDSLLNLPVAVNWNSLSQGIAVVSNKEVGAGLGCCLRSALHSALSAIFLERIEWPKITSDLNLILESSLPGEATLVSIASGASESLYQALKSNTKRSISLEDLIIPPLAIGTDTDNPGQTTTRDKIAVVGASGRFPSADNVSEFWDLLFRGLDVHKVVPPLRWESKTHVDASDKPRKNTSATPFGCWLDDAGLFDARFFGMSPREAEQVDPAQRIALMTAYEALEDGGIVPSTRSTQSSRVGVAYGVTSNDWMETNSAQNIDTYMIPGGNRAFIPGRINYFFKFSGPSYAVDTACSSSLAAIHIACNVLWRGEADTMIVGGTNILTNPDFTAGLDRGRFLSRTGNCKTFDDDADGYCRGEGVGTVILKRLEDAILDGDSIKAVIVNVCTNHSAESESITRPHLKAQRDIFTKVLNGLSPNKITYVEMHGTGTQVGDATEISSVLEAIAPNEGQHRRSEKDLVHIGSAKSNVGHGEAAAGVTSLIKLLLMMQHNTIPPHCGIKSRINRKFPQDMMTRGVRIATKPIIWSKNGGQPRHALLNNFSAAGGNTTLLLQDAPLREPTCDLDPRPTHPIAISGKTFSALQANARAILQTIEQGADLDPSSVSYTTTARRVHHAHRIAISGSSLQNIASKLSKAIEKDIGKSRALTQSTIFAFTGQGGHYIGMGRELYHSDNSFRNNIDRYNQLAINQGFPSFTSIIRDAEGNVASVHATVVQLAMTGLQMALAKRWIAWGVVPSGLIGHSLGHYAALHIAGVISEADAMFLVGTRAVQLQERCQPGTHSMMAVRASRSSISPFLDQTAVEIACVNGPQDVILSGLRADMELISSRLRLQQIRTVILDIPYAFHSSQVDCVLDGFASAISGVQFCPPNIPVLCPRTEQVVRSKAIFGPSHLVDHFRGTVNFVAAIEAARSEKLITENTIFVEIGHNSTVTSMLNATFGNSCKAFPSLKKNQDAWTTLTDGLTTLYMAGFDIRWDEYHRDFARNLRVITLPHYNWDLKHYWLKYVNDWSLRKGEPAQMVKKAPSLVTTTIHSVLKEELDDLHGKIILRSDLSRPELHSVAQGHKVNGLPLCTPSIYADIAITVGKYLQGKGSTTLRAKQICIDNMTIDKALISQPTGPQWLQTTITVDYQGSSTCVFSTVDDDGNVVTRHASCAINFALASSPTTLQEKARETHTAITQIREGLKTGDCYRFNNNMIYRMVAILADFDRGYRGLEEIILDSTAMAAASKIDFGPLPPEQDGEVYSVHPAYLDSLSQSAGFVMNANEMSDLDVECFVNHGWESFRMFGELRKEGSYQSYVKMMRGEGNIWRGTLTVVNDETVVAVFESLTLQGIPPRLLHHVLSSANKAQSRTKQESIDDSPTLNFPQGSEIRVDSPLLATNRAGIDSGLNQLVNIVAEESGIDKANLHDDTELADIGIDSLLSLLVTSRLKEDLDFDIGSGYSIFESFNTLGQLKASYARSKGVSLDTSSESSLGSCKDPTPSTPKTPDSRAESGDATPIRHAEKEIAIANETTATRPVTSLVLQTADASPILEPNITLFLFPDGSGSATSYACLPRISPRLTLIGLICPYRRDPHTMTCSLDSLIASYIAEIKRRQPDGAYSLGGWSSGGIYAYRAAQMLLESGATLRNLVLMDTPPPNQGLERLPPRFYKHCSDVGVFNQIGGGNLAAGLEGNAEDIVKGPPEWLIPHFNATIDLLASYSAVPLRLSSEMAVPRIALCWAGECALDGNRYRKFDCREEDGEGVRFLTEQRTEFGAGKWADLVPGLVWQVEVMKGWDHFNMMYGKGAKDLGEFIGRALMCS
ncbi:polyketide synthase [Melanomma pulvis-pyrius CBS 109.77]|uniref:Polyketide synthase n=1 Tax=Melanomma pulvis-pyrius CBS 109.77 TaxID=1314802 RepID=A0A6A6WUR0_9PLEO|nr:polyketide synthase [Melanomma pulvis-pyrius CBS 109.77]